VVKDWSIRMLFAPEQCDAGNMAKKCPAVNDLQAIRMAEKANGPLMLLSLKKLGSECVSYP